MKRKKRRRQKYGIGMTLLLWAGLFLLIAVFWSLYISGPQRLYEEQNRKVEAIIKESVPDIKGLDRHVFDYVTWQGYTDDTLFWFDATGKEITNRPIETLDYEGARARALADYDMEADTVELAFGYDSPCYQLSGDGQILLLNYDTFDRVYQRETDR